MHVWPPHMTWG